MNQQRVLYLRVRPGDEAIEMGRTLTLGARLCATHQPQHVEISPILEISSRLVFRPAAAGLRHNRTPEQCQNTPDERKILSLRSTMVRPS